MTMKILMITPYVTINSIPEFSRNKTGFGYMVMDIAKAVGKLEQVYVLATDTRGKSFESVGVQFLRRSVLQYISAIFSCLSLSVLVKLRKEYKMSNASFLRLIYYWLMTGFLKRILESGKYDIVHIHGCNFATELWMQVCENCGQKFVVTLHGLNSFSDTVRLESAGKKYERSFLKRVTDGEIPITVISTGMKKLVEKTYKSPGCKNITVVCNSFSFNEKGGGILDIRKLYHLDKDSIIILCVGNVSHRKNQGQLIKAFDLLPKHLIDNTYVLFLGGEIETGYSIAELAKKTSCEEHFIACGVVDKELVSQYYEQGSAVALMSLSEGFGLSLIEGMHFGLPSMSFTDVDAYEDIYDEIAMVGVEDHSDEAVEKGLEILLTNNWNREMIKTYSKKFESENMAKQYVDVYKREI